VADINNSFVFQFPFLLIPGEMVRWFFVFKAIVVPIAFLVVMCWSMHAVGGFASSPIAQQEATVSGSALGWAFMNALNASLGTYCTLGVNVADFTRYAKTPKAQYIQMFIIPVVFILVSFFGIATTSASKVLYGVYLWNPAEIFARWPNRAAVFFGSSGFAISIIGTNISANSISAAVDLMTLCPKYINLRRGQILAAFIGGWAFVPWNILASAIAFLNFMAGYTAYPFERHH
jgi:nucleobase:cation symporter-1, NCS1 family